MKYVHKNPRDMPAVELHTCAEQDSPLQVHLETHQPMPSACLLAFHTRAPRRLAGPPGCPDISADDISAVQPAVTCRDISPTAPAKHMALESTCFSTLFYHSSGDNDTSDLILLRQRLIPDSQRGSHTHACTHNRFTALFPGLFE